MKHNRSHTLIKAVQGKCLSELLSFINLENSSFLIKIFLINYDLLISNNALKGISPKPVRRFSVTQNLKDENWAKLSHPECGLRYELSNDEKFSLPTDLLQVKISEINSN